MDANVIYDDFIKIIKDEIKDGILPSNLDENLLQKDTHLNQLGLDSISLVSLLARLSDMTDNYYPDTMFSGNPTLWEISERASEEYKS